MSNSAEELQQRRGALFFPSQDDPAAAASSPSYRAPTALSALSATSPSVMPPAAADAQGRAQRLQQQSYPASSAQPTVGTGSPSSAATQAASQHQQQQQQPPTYPAPQVVQQSPAAAAAQNVAAEDKAVATQETPKSQPAQRQSQQQQIVAAATPQQQQQPWQSMVAAAASANIAADAHTAAAIFVPEVRPSRTDSSSANPSNAAISDDVAPVDAARTPTVTAPSTAAIASNNNVSSSNSGINMAAPMMTMMTMMTPRPATLREHRMQQQNLVFSPPLEAPWTRWEVEQRLAGQLLPAEKRRAEEMREVQSERRRFAMSLPVQPAVSFMSPEDYQSVLATPPPPAPPASHHHQHHATVNFAINGSSTPSPAITAAAATAATADAENFMLRQKVQFLEEQNLLLQVRQNVTAKRRRHLCRLADTMQLRSFERVARRMYGAWFLYYRNRSKDRQSHEARVAVSVAEKMMKERETQLHRERKAADESAAALLKEKEAALRNREQDLAHQKREYEALQTKLVEQLASLQQQQQQQQEREGFFSGAADSAARGPIGMNTSRAFAEHASPYSRINAKIHQQSVGRNRNPVAAAPSPGPPLSPDAVGGENTTLSAAGASNKNNTNHNNNNNNSISLNMTPRATATGSVIGVPSVTSATTPAALSALPHDQQQHFAVVSALERRIEQLTLRCMDQDQVISTLFTELSAVGQELERRGDSVSQFHPPAGNNNNNNSNNNNNNKNKTNNNNNNSVAQQPYLSPPQAAMLLTQRIDPPVHTGQMRHGVVSSWPHLSLSNSSNNNHNFSFSPEHQFYSAQQRPPPLTAWDLIALGQLLAQEDSVRLSMLYEERDEISAMAEMFAHDLQNCMNMVMYHRQQKQQQQHQQVQSSPAPLLSSSLSVSAVAAANQNVSRNIYPMGPIIESPRTPAAAAATTAAAAPAYPPSQSVPVSTSSSAARRAASPPSATSIAAEEALPRLTEARRPAAAPMSGNNNNNALQFF